MKIFGKEFKLNFKSLRFKLWLHFLFFAAVLMLLLWGLQIFFLNSFYQEMKISETKDTANSILEHYQDSDIVEKIRDIYLKNDMYIQIETSDGTIVFSPETEESWRPSYVYFSEMKAVREQLQKSKSDSVSVIVSEKHTSSNTLAFASYVDNGNGGVDVLYIFSPLYPVSSTVDILSTQLSYVTVISLLLACALSLILSNQIVKPIKKINNSAKKLAQGKYGIVFEGGHYSEIEELASTLTYTSLELEKSTNLQRDLIANVSHDLRTPLTMVKSYAEMIRDISGDKPEKRNAHLQVIIEEADRLNVLVSDMLSLSRMQSGSTVLEKRRFNLSETFENILHSYDIFAEKENYTIALDCQPDLYVNADEARINQVITNLVTNAIKYCGEDRTVLISVRQEGRNGHGSFIRCEVTDHGMGIAPEELDKIWDRYYKASTNHVRTTVGTGLGLSIVKEILVLHNAKFGVESTVGQGSTFWFELKAEKPEKGKQDSYGKI